MRECIFDRVENAEDADQPGDAQQSQDLAVGDHEPDVAVKLFGATLRTDERSQAGRIDELDFAQIGDQRMITALRRLDERGTNGGRGRDIQAPR